MPIPGIFSKQKIQRIQIQIQKKIPKIIINYAQKRKENINNLALLDD